MIRQLYRMPWYPDGQLIWNVSGNCILRSHSAELFLLNESICCDSNIFNYADDNHNCYKSKSAEDLCEVLRLDTNNTISWFEQNYMDANPNKFQGIGRGKDVPQSIVPTTQDYEILLSNHLKVVGVTLDDKLKVGIHIDSICLSASRQINALKRLSEFLGESNRVLIYKSCYYQHLVIHRLSGSFVAKETVWNLKTSRKGIAVFLFTFYLNLWRTSQAW